MYEKLRTIVKDEAYGDETRIFLELNIGNEDIVITVDNTYYEPPHEEEEYFTTLVYNNNSEDLFLDIYDDLKEVLHDLELDIEIVLTY